MTGETDLVKMLKTLKPVHIPGDYVFCVIQDLAKINISDAVMMFRENEGYTIILKKKLADSLTLTYSYIAGWDYVNSSFITQRSRLDGGIFKSTFSRRNKL